MTRPDSEIAFTADMLPNGEAELVRAEIVARLAISLSGERTAAISLQDRMRGNLNPEGSLAQFLTTKEKAHLAAAEVMLQTVEKGFQD